jgi:hypothetical protein
LAAQHQHLGFAFDPVQVICSNAGVESNFAAVARCHGTKSRSAFRNLWRGNDKRCALLYRRACGHWVHNGETTLTG